MIMIYKRMIFVAVILCGGNASSFSPSAIFRLKCEVCHFIKLLVFFFFCQNLVALFKS